MNPTKLIRSIFAKRLSQIDRYADYGDIIQQKTLLDLLQKAKNTEFGTKFKFNDISSYKSFAENIPINGYEELKPYIERTMSGEQNILWPTPIRHFAKSSGTTNDKSKFIPVSAESLRYCHYQGGSDCVALYLRENPQSRFFFGKRPDTRRKPGTKPFWQSLLRRPIGNTHSKYQSAHQPDKSPVKKIALMSEWDTKLEAIAESTIDRDITNLSGSTLVVSSPHQTHLKKKTGRQNLTEVWPNLEVFFPRRNQFSHPIANNTGSSSPTPTCTTSRPITLPKDSSPYKTTYRLPVCYSSST